jgi:hypothetical protein
MVIRTRLNVMLYVHCLSCYSCVYLFANYNTFLYLFTLHAAANCYVIFYTKFLSEMTSKQRQLALLEQLYNLNQGSINFRKCYEIAFSDSFHCSGGTAVAQWLRCCPTNRKVAGSTPTGVTGIFHLHNPSDRTMALGSTQPLTEMSTRSISWG